MKNRKKAGLLTALAFMGCVWAMPAYGAEDNTYVTGT